MCVCGEKRTKIEIAAIYQITTCMSCPHRFSFALFQFVFISQISEIQLINIVFVIIFVHTQLMRQKEWKWMCMRACVKQREKRKLSDKYCCNKSAHNFVNTNVRTTTVNSEFQPSWCLCLHLHLCWPSPCMTNIGDVGSFFFQQFTAVSRFTKKNTIIAELNQTEMNILR